MTSDAHNGSGGPDNTPSCATCGAALTSGASPAGLCARCLLTTALADDPDPNLEDESLTTFPPGTIIGSFRIERVLGRGGMATVYEAHDDRLNRAIALKVLPPEFLHDVRFAERFKKEARVVAALEHPNIVPIYASGIDAGIPWMSMRLLTGGTIGTLLEDGRPGTALTLRLLQAVASALDYAHAHGVIHRDIKPTNILLDAENAVCVGDFGLAHMLEASSPMTLSGALAGTPQYMAPEQALGKAVDHRCDIYSLAMVAYEMFVGAAPFAAASPFAILLKQVNDPLPEPPEQVVARPVMRVIRKGAAKDPGDRWPSATAFVNALVATAGVQPGNDASLLVRSRPRARRLGIPWMTAVGGAALAAVVAGWLVAREPSVYEPADGSPAALPSLPTSMDAAPMPGGQADPITPVAIPTSDPQGSRADPRQGSGAAQNVSPPTAQSAPSAIATPVGISPAEVAAPPPTIPDNDIPSIRTSDVPIAGLRGTPSPAPVDVVTAPVRVASVSPEYPQVARAALLEGDVVLEAVVAPDGKVTHVSIIRSVHPLLDEAARKAVLQYQYTPGRRNGVPEPATVRLTVSFRMR